jgi:hypothetical protein
LNSRTCYMPRPSHPPWYDPPRNFRQKCCMHSSTPIHTENAACNTSSIFTWRHNVLDAFLRFVCMAHYLVTAAVPPQFLLWANTPQYNIITNSTELCPWESAGLDIAVEICGKLLRAHTKCSLPCNFTDYCSSHHIVHAFI